MRFNNVLKDLFTEYKFTEYKIEKWNKTKDCWEYYRSFINYDVSRRIYNNILKNNEGIYRLIKIIEIDER